jgi:hypothetical protein
MCVAMADVTAYHVEMREASTDEFGRAKINNWLRNLVAMCVVRQLMKR